MWVDIPEAAECIDAEARVRQRQKQVLLGKATVGYANYVAVVPQSARDPRVHVDTPPSSPSSIHVSKRKWERQLRCWRQFLHQYDFAGPYVQSPEAFYGAEGPEAFYGSDLSYSDNTMGAEDTFERCAFSSSAVSGGESYDSDSQGLSPIPPSPPLQSCPRSCPPSPPSTPPPPPPLPITTNDVWSGLSCSCLSDSGAAVRTDPDEDAPVMYTIPQGGKVVMLGAVSRGDKIWGRVGDEGWCRIVSKDGISFYPVSENGEDKCVVLEGLSPVADSIQWCVDYSSSPSDLEMMSAYF